MLIPRVNRFGFFWYFDPQFLPAALERSVRAKGLGMLCVVVVVVFQV